jgi:hypothetical protein
MLLHFVGGFSKSQGMELNELELLAIARAKLIYPQALIKAHTQIGSWLNLPDYCERVEVNQAWSWPNYEIKLGEHLADKIRILVLIQEGGLYIDTDVLCINALPFGDKLIVSKERDRGQKINSGIIYSPKPNNPFLLAWLAEYLTSSPDFKSKAIIAICKASVPLAQGITCFTFKYFSKSD